MKIKANCKINIGLDVLRKRDDGFHDLSTVMYPVRGLYDEIEVEPITAADNEFHSLGIVVDCPAEQNLCLKAARLIQQRYDVGRVRITLDKRVPFGAGLGGGSSDATAVLVAMNEIFSLSLDESELITLASQLGSDTAFFVRNTPQLCEGRGDVMTPVELDFHHLWLVLVKPDEGVSTREAYAGVKPMIPASSLVERLRQPMQKWQGSVKNDFEPSVFAAHPVIASIKQQLIDCGAVYASMSGSGSTVFGIFDTKEQAEKIRSMTDYIFEL
ncbi:MAG: 4-(cytidine 5'-diphospho)-2-C-methyl-D-erythritol kinase [Alistipes sp.]|nr:4-(cytidine 5'-diphospho)-2-C-methyl-D-erythritol kinase [Alistipes sp.]